jgi:hypothetical protein
MDLGSMMECPEDPGHQILLDMTGQCPWCGQMEEVTMDSTAPSADVEIVITRWWEMGDNGRVTFMANGEMFDVRKDSRFGRFLIEHR